MQLKYNVMSAVIQEVQGPMERHLILCLGVKKGLLEGMTSQLGLERRVRAEGQQVQKFWENSQHQRKKEQ